MEFWKLIGKNLIPQSEANSSATLGSMPSQATANAPESSKNASANLPKSHLTLEETLRVMDVAREMREQRQSAEEMFRRDDLRHNLRNKLLRQAKMSGNEVTGAEIDAAISQYLERRHVYEDPPAGLSSFLAHAWVYRAQIIIASVATAAATGGFLWFFGA